MAESANSRQITAGRWQKLKAILADALEETSSSRRAELLRQACANDVELLRDAEALLSGDTASLEQFAEWAQMHLREDLPERVGEQLGAYRIIKEIGRGGMGAVYLAERADGQFEREVALKVLKTRDGHRGSVKAFSSRTADTRQVRPPLYYTAVRLTQRGSTWCGCRRRRAHILAADGRKWTILEPRWPEYLKMT